MHIHLHKVPFLAPQCPKEARVNDLRACEIMATEVQFLRPIERVGRLLDTLASNGHNLFPLLEDDHTVFGTVQRDTLCALLSVGAFSAGSEVDLDLTRDTAQSPVVPYRELERFFPHYPDVDSLAISKEDRQRWIDLRPYANTAPYTISEAASVPRTYRLFRLLGMRHLLVVDRKGRLLGVITRHDLLEEHILAALQHSPLLRTKTVWTMQRPEGEGEWEGAGEARAGSDGKGGEGVAGEEVVTGPSPTSASMP
jgi:chloride channel 7